VDQSRHRSVEQVLATQEWQSNKVDCHKSIMHTRLTRDVIYTIMFACLIRSGASLSEPLGGIEGLGISLYRRTASKRLGNFSTPETEPRNNF